MVNKKINTAGAMSKYQQIYLMQNVSSTYKFGKKCPEKLPARTKTIRKSSEMRVKEYPRMIKHLLGRVGTKHPLNASGNVTHLSEVS